MSKVDDLRKKYNNISNLTFLKFVESDNTETKKYLQYYCMMWTKRQFGAFQITTSNLVKLVSKFDELLPYIDNKDIYSPIYNNIETLSEIISDAEIKKSEKTFNKLEHIDILIDNDDYLLISPKTHEGSIKYGSNTKWCTASRYEDSHFKKNTKNKTLIYLINKNKTIDENYNKIAFVLSEQKHSLISYIECWNQIDKKVTDEILIEKGWSFNDLIEITFAIRFYAQNKNIQDVAINNIKGVIRKLEGINLNEFQTNIDILKNVKENSFAHQGEKIIKEFLEKIKNILQ